jgi:hypothetical protein
MVATMVTSSTTEVFVPMTRWFPKAGLSEVDFSVDLLAVDGDADAEVMPGAQTAAVRTDNPDSPAAISGSYVSTAGPHHFSDTLAATSKAFVRFGMMYRLKTGESGQAAIQAGLSVAGQQCGRLLPARAIDVQPWIANTDQNTFAISDWIPTVGLSKVLAAFMVLDNANNGLEYQLIVRTCNNVGEPNSWQLAEGSWTNPSTGNSERHTGELSVPAGANLSSNHRLQVGVAVRKTGSNNPRATIRVLGGLVY